MHKKTIFMIAVLLMIAGAAFVSGCTGTESQKTVQTTEVPTALQTETAVVQSADNLEWIVWREGSNTLKQLGGYFSYSPNVNGQKFKALKVEVRANNPVTVLFLSDKELSNFEKKMSTNSGEYTPVARYDDVNYKVMEEYSDEYLNVVIWNQGSKIVTTDFDIWYKNIV
ncbi:MAG: hypothetical protein JXQ82_04225 [Methanomicrobiaceae archaeon]|nr:hypothetical protein [Methanomicrobiaceae archaeon]